jgi:tetratricopeptide (TPR) repeat protein
LRKGGFVTELMNLETIKQEILELFAQAEALQSGRDKPEALEKFLMVIKLAETAGWSEKKLEALYNTGLLLQELKQPDEAIKSFQTALELALQLDDKQSAGVLLVTLGFACANAGYDEDAIGYLSDAVENGLDESDFENTYSTLSTLGVLLSNHNRPLEAIPYYRQALELARAGVDELAAVADTLGNLGVAYEKAGRLDEAISTISEYRQILFEVGDLRVKEATLLLKRLRQKAGYRD